jgi:hypothetical protein
MLGADIALAQRDAGSGPSGWAATDMWSDGFAYPLTDAQQVRPCSAPAQLTLPLVCRSGAGCSCCAGSWAQPGKREASTQLSALWGTKIRVLIVHAACAPCQDVALVTVMRTRNATAVTLRRPLVRAARATGRTTGLATGVPLSLFASVLKGCRVAH